MTALGKLLRTTAFKLTLVYLTVFALFAAFLLGYFAWNTRRLITEQITQTVDAEITGLAEQYRQGGIRRLVFVVDARSRRPGSSLYLVTARAGRTRGQCRIALDRHSRNVRLDGNRLSAFGRSRRRRASRPDPCVSIAGRLPAPGRTRSRRARTLARHCARGRPLVVGSRHRARCRRRILRHTAGAQARGRDDGDDAADHGRRSDRAPPDCG